MAICHAGFSYKPSSLVPAAQYGVTQNPRQEYHSLKQKASDCIACRACEKWCPFDVEVVKRIHLAVERFGC